MVPVTIDIDDYVVRNISDRENIQFYHIPFAFILRDGWGFGTVNLRQTFENSIKSSTSSKAYSKGNRDFKLNIFRTLIKCIESNENDQDLPDQAILAGAVMEMR